MRKSERVILSPHRLPVRLVLQVDHVRRVLRLVHRDRVHLQDREDCLEGGGEVIEDIAQVILVPYLFLFGYDMDPESIAECRDAIEVQRKEKRDVRSDNFVLCDHGSRDQSASLQPRSRTGSCSND